MCEEFNLTKAKLLPITKDTQIVMIHINLIFENAK